MVGSKELSSEIVADALRDRFEVEYVEKAKIPHLSKLKESDVVYGIHLQTCSRYIVAAKALRKKSIIHFVGSDAHRYARERGMRRLYWRTAVHVCDLVFYVSPHLMELVERRGAVLPLPIRVDLFKKSTDNTSPEKDILYYCPGKGAIVYRLSWILDYAKKHPNERITITGNPRDPADHKVDMPNVEVIPFVPHDRMAELYARHRQLIRMTTQDGAPSMLDEALLCGLEVIFNGRKVTKILPERNPDVFARRFEEELRRIL